MIEQSITIVNKLGLHARAAAKFVTTASQFTSDIQVARNGRIVNGKSIMGLMMLAAAKGTDIVIHINGEDEQDAFDNITALIENYFGEGE
ncbi:MAG: HPr family phosphocarrier protein [Piscirickettsiaceae bacterium]|jgi:phosphocarrier protein HPr|nr:HPr family phosphocarrier protein [Piscirickettsiaceae bacterium]